ncbi:MarR family transcriptional regulator [Streptomyces sp. SID8366]|uniref:MarR family winged helix-turn-helix transcriptional regulator n=1 Tax=unclassified Streptomyces TaxID=2593676 RepID=UPI000DB95F57|nr:MULTISPECIES: helix-turn-helix domain-containing protein [unclassified Streptomyces]MYU05678.1 MarR family transcriptional regulator [Streptomyces sp. SID8366]MYU66005.1 MarR family transcriptional regulator [Streptomyces sp. SID69]RAJ63728.1 DNA-binding MarR family transcriptional regulator [Streptomyces sp. PsTaAH-130]
MADELALLVADVYEAAGALRRAGEALAAAEGQTQARWQLMSAVSEQPLPVARAARRLGIARQGVQRIANDLVRDGLAEYLDNPDHRTSPLLSLTAVGHGTLDAITARATTAHRVMAEGIAGSDLATVREMLRRLTRQTDDWAGAAGQARGARPKARTATTREEDA